MANPGVPGSSAAEDPVPEFMANKKPRRNSIFSAVRDLNATAYPDRHYKNHLMEEVRKWKWMAQNALELSVSMANNTTPNTSVIQDASVVSKMKTFIDERPDLEEYMKKNKDFVNRAQAYSRNIAEIHDRLRSFCEDKDLLVQEISNDVRDSILLDC